MRALWEKVNAGQKKEDALARKLVFGTVFFLYVLINLLFIIWHEPYRDEANVWLMAKYLTPGELLSEIHYQGHPVLWYFLVMPFAKIGLPYKTIEVLSLAIMSVAAYLFLFKGKLIGLTKIMCVFSPVFMFFYPVIARGYCLIILCLVLIALVYPKRYKNPMLYGILIALLVQADTVAIGIAGGISIAWLVEASYLHFRKKSPDKYLKTAISGLWLPLLSLIFWILQMKEEFFQMGGDHASFSRDTLLRDCKDYAFYMAERITGWNKEFMVLCFLVILVASLVISICTRNFSGLFVFGFGYAFQAAFSVMVYGLHIWHFISVAFLFYWMGWILQADSERKLRKEDAATDIKRKIVLVAKYALNIVMIVFAIGAFMHWNSDEEPSNLKEAICGTYSNAHEAAEFIRSNIDADDIIVSTNVAMDSAMLPYLDEYQFVYAATGETYTHAIYAGDELKTISVTAMKDMVRERYPDVDKFYLIVASWSNLDEQEALVADDIIYESNIASNRGEDYRIYQMKVDY